MTLSAYLKREKITIKEFCKIHGFGYGHIRHIKEGCANPSAELALRIEQATGGKVDRLELLYPDAKW
jgi:hypothetical protein